MPCVVKIHGLVDGNGTAFDGHWLVDYDPDRPSRSPEGLPMNATIVTTPDRRMARVFADIGDALRFTRRHKRDQRQARPLTAFTLEYEPKEAR